uniref:Intraflagellar transport protein 46 homolog n=1 Tax=Schistosoma japonicum TaxID=6182 RepID=IFT46_SCHJA|nr:RecName: Full=Intraflagellar transport protein 46 homolog [Schistosoma japonicum]AAW24711.1 SJCHGC08984 protein [Schistosoma japonicum]
MDRPYDETVDIPDSEDIATPRLQQSLAENLDKLRDSYGDNSKLLTKTNSELANRSIKTASKSVIRMDSSSEKLCDRGSSDDDDDDDNDDDEDEDDDDDDENANIHDATEGVYNPADYEHLTVSSEIKEIFEYIQRYTPQTIELETKLKPFIPDYIPAVGDIDAFLKVPRPDGKPDYLGLLVLDEPCANQSDPTVLDLQLRALSKQTTTKQVTVKSLENAEHQTKAIENWIKSIADLYRTKPPPTVHYTKNMPEISQLMSEWPKSFEESISNMQLSLSQLDCSLKDYVDIICALLDIPVYNNRIHSLHLLFSLYLEFKNSQHFRQNESVIT